ncbi:MAG TPA: Asp-tRNA(Asn)/Glu-tRNA(Gln) amidotransferase subunit GatC, partial [Blastocatellia bacterium]
PRLETFMSGLTREDVRKIADLARLQLTAEETDSFTVQLAAIIDYVAKLNEVEISGAEGEADGVAAQIQASEGWRDDVVQPCLGQQKALEEAPDAERGHFRVPKVIGG